MLNWIKRLFNRKPVPRRQVFYFPAGKSTAKEMETFATALFQSVKQKAHD